MRHIERNRVVDPKLRYVAGKPLMVGSRSYQAGDEVDISVFTKRRFRQLVEWRRLIPVSEPVEELVTETPKPKTSRPKLSLKGKSDGVRS